MPLQLYNTRTRRLEAFVPRHPPHVAMYVCGPTVYDEPHIGHARSAYVFDVIRRWLTYRKYDVHFVRNVTDVDDKIIQRAQQDGRPPHDVAEQYLEAYHRALASLGIPPLDAKDEPRATQYIDAMTDMIGKLLIDGIAYEGQGGVYFSVKHFAGYGRLSNRTLDEMQAGLPAAQPPSERDAAQAGARVEPGEGKRDPLDFALWKAAKPGEPSWPSPWGEGRPGWHIECSAMSTACLGAPTIDIHGGGLDLLFPHHENEIAQSEAASKQSPFATYWLHHGLLTINGQKMSKSLGNFVTVEQVVQRWGADTLKMFFLSAHYRSPLNYMDAAMAASKQRYDNYRNLMDLADNEVFKAEIKESVKPIEELEECKREFLSALDDDLNTPQAISALDKMRSLGARWLAEEKKEQCLSVIKALKEYGELFGLEMTEETTLSKQINDLFEQYKTARSSKNFKASDALRKKLSEEGFSVQDTGETSRIIPKR